MSGTFEKRDGFLYSPFKLNQFEKELFIVLFDEQVSFDISVYEAELKEKKLLKRICLIKTIVFPLEYIFIRIVLGKNAAKERFICQQFYWKFIRNKLTLDAFKRELNLIVTQSIIGN